MILGFPRWKCNDYSSIFYLSSFLYKLYRLNQCDRKEGYHIRHLLNENFISETCELDYIFACNLHVVMTFIHFYGVFPSLMSPTLL